MRSPTAIATHGHGKSRSKPLHSMHHQGAQPSKKLIIQHKGYQKTMALYDAVIRKTAKPITVKMKPMKFAIKKAFNSLKGSL